MKKILAILFTCAMIMACGSDDGGTPEDGNTSAAVLGMPLNNSECISGVEVSNTQSKVTFQWTAAPDNQTYFLYVKNLTTHSTLQYNAANSTTFDVTLDKGTPYSWYVGSKKIGGSTVNSDTWKFYNAGLGVSNYAPFPAELVAPVMSSSISGPSVSLEWDGSDLDGDISYEVYVDTTNDPTTLAGTTTEQILTGVAVTSGNTYYWKVITTDDTGNITTSPIFQFKVL